MVPLYPVDVRLSRRRIRRSCVPSPSQDVHAVACPCVCTTECPHDRDLGECEAVEDYNTASKRPSSLAPHALRRGSVARDLNDGMPEETASDRTDTSPEILREHYNAQTEEDKRGLQREFLDNM